MIKPQLILPLSRYSDLYDILVPKDHTLRKMHDEIDFSFIRQELYDKYSPDMGRTAYCPVLLFKYLILKVLSQLSDVDLIEEVKVNMAYKYFLDMRPEDMPIEASTLCKFRRQRLKDVDLLTLLLSKTFQMAEEAGILIRQKDNKFHIRAIIDGTHTEAFSSFHRPVPALKQLTKKLRHQLYECVPGLEKGDVETDHDIDSKNLTEEIEYAKYLIGYTKRFGIIAEFPRVKRVLNRLAEMVDDIVDHYSYSPTDPDARIGHKTADTEFFGYKTQIIEDADSELILAAGVTSGEVGDALPGKETMETLLSNPDIKVEELLGDTAYSGKPFLELARDNDFELIAPPHPKLGVSIDGRDGFTFNKDADMFICPQGHLAISKRIITYKKDNNRKAISYQFDKHKCAACPLKETCLKGRKNNGRSFSVSLLTKEQQELMERSRTGEFKRRRRERYKIEAKNAHLKRGLGFGKTQGNGIEMMELQTAITIFISNIKKIYAKKR